MFFAYIRNINKTVPGFSLSMAGIIP